MNDSRELTKGGDGQKQQHLYKVLVIGDYAVGKTSIIKRYCEGYFTPNYKLTIGVDFAVKVVEWDEKTTVSLQVPPILVFSILLTLFSSTAVGYCRT